MLWKKISIVMMVLVSFAYGISQEATTRKVYVSTNKNYEVITIDFKVKDEIDHAFIIKNANTNKEIVRVPFERSLGVQWASNLNMFYVNDYYASNQTDAYVYVIGETDVKKIDVRKVLIESKEYSRFLEEHHCYIELQIWANMDVSGVVKGYGDSYPKGFKKKFKFNVQKYLNQNPALCQL